MTAQRDPDRLVRAFFQEGPAELSPRLLAGIREDVHQTRQRAPRRPWRNITMPRPILLFAVLGALLLAAGAFALALPGARPAPSTIPIASPAGSGAVVAEAATPSATTRPTPTVTPYPLADGEAWIALGNGSGGLRLIRPDGTGSHDILGGLPIRVSAPADWSRDGRQFTFDGNGERGSQIWVANADGTGARQLTPYPTGCPEQACTEGVQPAWSPDGRTIAFIAPTHAPGADVRYALVLLDIATGATTELYATSDVALLRPSWSPDGGRIALEVQHFSGAPETSSIVSTTVGIVDVAGKEHTPREITDPGLLAGYPDWHPTKDLIVFRTNRVDDNTKTWLDYNAPSDLYTIKPDGTGMKKLTDNVPRGAIIRAPSWTPDGRILFSRLATATADEQLRVIDASGANETSATGDVATFGEGRWRPTP